MSREVVLDRLENVEDAARRLGLSPVRVRALLREGRIEGTKKPAFKNHWYVLKNSVPQQGDPFEGYEAVAEAAKRLGIGERRVRWLASRGLIDAEKPGYSWLIPREAVHRG